MAEFNHKVVGGREHTSVHFAAALNSAAAVSHFFLLIYCCLFDDTIAGPSGRAA